MVTETYTHCSSAIHFCWVTRPRAGSFMSWPLHKSGTQPPNYMRTAWGLKSLASKNDNKNTNICIYISACQEVAVEDASITKDNNHLSLWQRAAFMNLRIWVSRKHCFCQKKYRYTNQAKPKTVSISHPTASSHVTCKEITS